MPLDVELATQSLLREAGELRHNAYLSIRQVGTALGLQSHGNLSALEQGRTIPRLDRFIALLDVYGYTLEIVPQKKDGPE